jgi:NADP-dependent alcohol dehydrogenase
LYGLDHAQTLAIVLPGMLRVRKEGKRAKLLQYARRVWNITDGDDDARIEDAIRRTQAFFEQMGVKTSLTDYKLGAQHIETILDQLERHRMVTLGEQRDVTLDVTRKVLESSV